MQLNQLRGAHVALHGAVDDDGAGIDFGLDAGAVTDDEHVLGHNLAVELAVDANLTLEGELPLELAALAEQRVNLTRTRCHGFILPSGAT